MYLQYTHIMSVYALICQDVSIPYITICMGLQVADLPCDIPAKCWKSDTTEGKTTSVRRAELENKLVGIYFIFLLLLSFILKSNLVLLSN